MKSEPVAPPPPTYWRKEYVWSYATVKRTAVARTKKLGNVLREYARYCTLHGVQYIFRDNSNLVERCTWLAIVLMSFVCATFLVYTMWLKFSASPTVTAVKDTHLALYLLPFPAVSVCPMDKIRRPLAHEYLMARLKGSYRREETDNFLNALSLLQHPIYNQMTEYLERTNDFLDDLVMPTCEEVFGSCFWIGHSYNCCELFSLQRTEEGFCYSFNSLNSIEAVNCPKINTLEVEENLIADLSGDWNCSLRRNTAAGATTGLQLYFNKFNESERLVNASDISGPQSMKVQVFYATEYPESGVGTIVHAKKGLKLNIMVKPYVTISTDAIRQLSIEERFCYFPDEQQLSVSKSYTQKSCLIECRLNYIHEKCHCRPYYFNMIDNRVPVCNSTQLMCIARHNSELRFFSPPVGNIRGFLQVEKLSPLNCSQCLPTCHESVYDIDVDYSLDSHPLTRDSYGAVDIFYRNEGAVKYQRDVTFGWIDLLVSFGGIAGLFLGFSLLTIIEFVYWGIKLLIQYSHYIMNKNKVLPN